MFAQRLGVIPKMEGWFRRREEGVTMVRATACSPCAGPEVGSVSESDERREQGRVGGPGPQCPPGSLGRD